MTRRRFYVPRDSIQNGTAYLPPDQSHHLRDVLRIGTGETVEIFDGEGTGYVGQVSFRDSVAVIHRLQRLPSKPHRLPLILAAALIKSAKFEWLLQKATELGVDEIIPIETLRSDIRIPRNKIARRHERWDRIVREASKQCRRFSAPRVRLPLDYSDLLLCGEFSGFSRMLFHEKATRLWRPEEIGASDGVVLCIGPEGGWEDGEIEYARNAGYDIFSLGSRILRAETAAVAAVSVVQYHLDLQRSADIDI